MYPIIGRSERDDIISNGVCLSRDLEVSSFHGKVGLTGIIDCVVLSARRPAEVQRYEQYKPQLCQRVGCSVCPWWIESWWRMISRWKRETCCMLDSRSWRSRFRKCNLCVCCCFFFIHSVVSIDNASFYGRRDHACLCSLQFRVCDGTLSESFRRMRVLSLVCTRILQNDALTLNRLEFRSL